MSDNVFAGTMTLDNSRFIAAMDRVHNATSAALSPLKTMALGLTGLGGAFAALESAKGIIDGVMGAFTKGRDLEILHRETGQSIADLVELQKAFVSVKMPAESVGTALFMLNKALGGVNEMGEPTDKAFARIGLSIGALKNMSAVDQFHAIIAGMAKLPTEADKSSVAMGIFGRSARDLQALLNDPAGFDAAVKAAGPMAEVMMRNAAAFEKVDKTIQAIQAKMAGFWAGIAEGLAPALQVVLDVLNKINLLDIGEKIGRTVRLITEAFKEGKVGEIISLSLQIGFMKAVNSLLGMLAEIPDVLVGVLQAAFNPELFQSISEMFLGVAQAFGAQLVRAVAKVLQTMSTALDYLIDKGQTTHDLAQKNKDIEKDKRDIALQEETVAGSKKYAEGITDPFDKKMALAAAQDEIDKLNDLKKRGPLKADTEAGQKLFDRLNMSFAGYMQAHQDDNKSQVAENTTEQLKRDAGGHVEEGYARFRAATQPVDDALKRMGKSVETMNVFGDALGAKTSKLGVDIAGLNAAVDADKGTPDDDKKDDKKTAPGFLPLSYKMPEGDRLSKFGLFVGASPSAPGLSEARRTAAATEGSLKTLNELLPLLRGGGPSGAITPRYL